MYVPSFSYFKTHFLALGIETHLIFTTPQTIHRLEYTQVLVHLTLLLHTYTHNSILYLLIYLYSHWNTIQTTDRYVVFPFQKGTCFWCFRRCTSVSSRLSSRYSRWRYLIVWSTMTRIAIQAGESGIPSFCLRQGRTCSSDRNVRRNVNLITITIRNPLYVFK